MEENLVLFIGIIFAFVGALFTAIGIIIKNNYQKKIAICTAQTTARVIDIVTKQSTRRDSDGFSHTSTTYSPTLEYYSNGVRYENTPSVSSSPCKYEVGQEVLLNFNSNNPDNFYLPDDNSNKMLYRIFIGLGLLFFAIGVIMSICSFIDFSGLFGDF